MERPYSASVDDPTDTREANVLAELYDALDRRPRDIEIYEMLIEAWWHRDEEMAYGVAAGLLEIDRTNGLAQEYLRRRQPRHTETMSREDFEAMEMELEEGYMALKFEAKVLKKELASDYFRNMAEDQDTMLSNLHSISKGDIASAMSTSQPVSAREAAREILANKSKATDLILGDLEAVVRWLNCQSSDLSTEKLRARLLKRRSILEAALPESMQPNFKVAFWLIERDHLQRQYVNTETMLHDEIKDIPRDNFFVSEDNYAFDMEEMVSAIRANNGVMRNPLSRSMFSEHDIRFILDHPIGKRLRPLEEEQQRSRRGASAATITKIAALGKTMLEDQSMDAGPSRRAIDEFIAYVATLPSSEQATIRQLKIPATDKNTSQPFDYSINESVSDAKSGVTCYHKVGDFLTQAATYLRQQ